ncbi:hypothetical protein EI613_25845 [Azospirillum sp. 412522]|nr:hypothetical protein [Azospirillum sp. 412522]
MAAAADGVPVKRGVSLESFRPHRAPSNIRHANCRDPPHFPLRFWIDPITVSGQLEREGRPLSSG